MAAARVAGQKATSTSTGTTLDLSLPSLPTAGNYVVVAFGYYTPATITSVVDTQGSPLTNTEAVKSNAQANRTAIYYAKIPAGTSGTYTVRITTSSNFISGTIQEVSGLAASLPVDVTGTNNGGSAASGTVTASGASAQADSYAVGVIGFDSSIGTITMGTAGSPAWASVGTFGDGETTATHGMADRIPTASATETESGSTTAGTHDSWTAALAVFKAASGAAAPLPAPGRRVLQAVNRAAVR
jgi:hypothetical protein